MDWTRLTIWPGSKGKTPTGEARGVLSERYFARCRASLSALLAVKAELTAVFVRVALGMRERLGESPHLRRDAILCGYSFERMRDGSHQNRSGFHLFVS